jgi:enterochelin esterase family protein
MSTLSDSPLSFNKIAGFPYTSTNGNNEEGGMLPAYECLENGDIVIRFPTTQAKMIEVKSNYLAEKQFRIMLCPKDKYFEGVLSNSIRLSGNVILQFIVDGTEVVNPYIPVEFSGGRLMNCLELPDKEMRCLEIQQIPHGTVAREIFWSETVNAYERCMIYLPPGYESGGEYPVLYLQHGGGENETCWMYNGKLPYMMDDLIAHKHITPFIVVTNDGLEKISGQRGINNFDGIEGIITEDCRKYIEGKYRTRHDKWGRAIAGLSLGSMQSVYIGLRHPELFGYIGSFTYLRCRDKSQLYEENPHLKALTNPTQFMKDYKLFFRSIGGNELHLNEFEEDDKFLAENGIDQLPIYVRKVYPKRSHVWNNWRRAFYDFAQYLFKEKQD